MNVFKLKSELEAFLGLQKKENKTIGFVPTMGALHRGHLSLIESAKLKNSLVVVSIFVNPTQFDNSDDLKKYPKPLENDLKLLKQVKCDVVFIPDVKEIYSKKITSQNFDFDGLELEMEGKHREGHFDGVGTIVKKLFEIIKPDNAYFGEKDFQQLQIIKKLVKKLNIPLKIIGLPIYRESNGLAMSSRNSRLSEQHKKAAPFIYEVLRDTQQRFTSKTPKELTLWVEEKFKNNELLQLEYFTIAEEETLKTTENIQPNKNYRAFIAAYAGNVRLIDNIRLQ
ncbi:pantoate--beta-alanine ligase [Tenacibaculum sp. C7A-26P2]|uniref:pantoate--beta-alanine ligase n=1 Tax=Tenacibaculum sp. C7A-26P2 TaxID=3447504 RepID=UPI003F85BA64